MPFPDDDGADTSSRPSFRSLYFSCSIGAHCIGKQRLRVDVDIEYGSSSSISTVRSSSSSSSSLPPREEDPVSKFVLGVDEASCALVQNGEASESSLDRFMESSCEDPVEGTGEY